MPLRWSDLSVRMHRGGRVRCEPGWELSGAWSRRLADFDLWFVWAGNGRMVTRGGPITLRPGVCLWMRPGGLYEASQDARERLGVTFIHFDLVDDQGRAYPGASSLLGSGHGQLPREVHDLLDVNYVDAVTRRILELRQEGPRGARDARRTGSELLKALLMDFDGSPGRTGDRAVAGTERHHRDLMRRAAATIAQSPSEAPAVAQLARTAGYTPDHFTRVFKQQLGLTPQAYAVRARLERARQLLLESSLSIGQIAQGLGYRDVYFFSRQFKEKTGRTPSSYRAKN